MLVPGTTVDSPGTRSTPPVPVYYLCTPPVPVYPPPPRVNERLIELQDDELRL